MKTEFKAGDTVICINAGLFPKQKNCPPLQLDKEYPVKKVYTDKDGYDHLDVGLISELEFVRCYETLTEIPLGDKIHWCHPSRFKLA